MKKATTTVSRRWSLCTPDSGRVSKVWVSRLRFRLRCLWLLVGLLFMGSPTQASIKAGDILVIDAIGGTNQSGALFVVNPKTGNRRVLSDFGDAAQGSLGNGDLTGVAVGPAGRIVVSALLSGDPPFVGGALFAVNPDTGARTVLSNFSQGDLQGNLYPKSTDKGVKNAVSTNNHGLSHDFASSPNG